jgi:hypothetical protein
MEQIRKSCLRLKTIEHDKKPSYSYSLIFVVFFGLTNKNFVVFLASILTMTITSLQFFFLHFAFKTCNCVLPSKCKEKITYLVS